MDLIINDPKSIGASGIMTYYRGFLESGVAKKDVHDSSSLIYLASLARSKNQVGETNCREIT